MPALAKDTFERQMTETLKIKGVKKLGDLVQHYKTIGEALDENDQGVQSYEKAKNITLRFKKRDGDFTDLKKLWTEYEKQLQENEVDTTTQQHDSAGAQKSVQKTEVQDVQEIKSDKDLAVVIMAMVQEAFYNPQTGFWPDYDKKFDKKSFTDQGKPGWENPDNQSARQDINRKKNEEIQKIMNSDFVKNVCVQIHETMMTQVFGVRKRDTKHAVKNHVRFHLYDLIYKK